MQHSATAASDSSESAYWTEQRTAKYLGLAAITLKTRRQRGHALLPAYRFGRRVMYRVAEVMAWADSRRIANTNTVGRVA